MRFSKFLPLRIVKINGPSMEPTLSQGDFVLIRKISQIKRLKLDDLILFEQDNTLMIKRVSRIEENNFFVLGDNPDHSTDSRQFGLILFDQVRGKVIKKL